MKRFLEGMRRSVNSGTVVMIFGRGKLVQLESGAYEFRGGGRGDVVVAREWVTIFIPAASVDWGSEADGESDWVNSGGGRGCPRKRRWKTWRSMNPMNCG